MCGFVLNLGAFLYLTEVRLLAVCLMAFAGIMCCYELDELMCDDICTCIKTLVCNVKIQLGLLGPYPLCQMLQHFHSKSTIHVQIKSMKSSENAC